MDKAEPAMRTPERRDKFVSMRVVTRLSQPSEEKGDDV